MRERVRATRPVQGYDRPPPKSDAADLRLPTSVHWRDRDGHQIELGWYIETDETETAFKAYSNVSRQVLGVFPTRDEARLAIWRDAHH
jgi:hypothetical protein